MGVYIYSILSPKNVVKVKLDTGAIMSVAKFVYCYKPYYSMFEKEPRWQILAKARLLRMENLWNKYIKDGGTWPQGGVLCADRKDGYKIEVGSQVMTWPKINSIPTDLEDCYYNHAVIAGKVIEIVG